MCPHANNSPVVRNRLLHYANLTANVAKEKRRLAAFLEVSNREKRLPKLLEHCSMDDVRKGVRGAPLEGFFEKGADSFTNKGVSVRWRHEFAIGASPS